MKRGNWFDKFIGCAFSATVDMVNCHDESWIFEGVAENPSTENGKPLQYVFSGEKTNANLVTSYRDARKMMGAMIDKYK